MIIKVFICILIDLQFLLGYMLIETFLFYRFTGYCVLLFVSLLEFTEIIASKRRWNPITTEAYIQSLVLKKTSKSISFKTSLKENFVQVEIGVPASKILELTSYVVKADTAAN